MPAVLSGFGGGLVVSGSITFEYSQGSIPEFASVMAFIFMFKEGSRVSVRAELHWVLTRDQSAVGGGVMIIGSVICLESIGLGSGGS